MARKPASSSTPPPVASEKPKSSKPKAEKAKPKRKTKAASKGPSLHLSRRTKGWIAAGFTAVCLGFGNWFAHQPAAERAQFGSWEPMLEKLGAVTAGITDDLGITGRDASIPYTQKLPTQTKFWFGQPKVTDLKKAVKDIRILKRQGYWAAWSPVCGHPAYVVYTVPKTKLMDKSPPRPDFKRDPEALDCPSPEDYLRSGYDRGHMAPNHLIATRYGRKAQDETFLMSNMVPQKPDLNRGPWRELEQIVADDLSNSSTELWVITGPVPNDKKSYINRGKARIPKGFFKIIAKVKRGRLSVMGLYMPQEIRIDKQPRYCFVSIDQIEAMTGLDFFSDLPEADQKILEEVEPTRFWPSLELF